MACTLAIQMAIHTRNVHIAYQQLVHLQLWDNPQAQETQWYIKPVKGGTYNILNAETNKYINVAGKGKHNGPCA